MIVSPTTVALNPQQGAAVPALKVGEIIEAKVLELLGQSIAKLAVGKSVLEVQTQVPLTPGSIVRLAVKNTPDGIRLTLLPNAPASGSSSGTPAPTTATTLQAGTASLASENATTAAQPLITGTLANGNAGTAAGVTVAAHAPDVPLPTQSQPPTPAVAAQAAVTAAVQSSAARQG